MTLALSSLFSKLRTEPQSLTFWLECPWNTVLYHPLFVLSSPNTSLLIYSLHHKLPFQSKMKWASNFHCHPAHSFRIHFKGKPTQQEKVQFREHQSSRKPTLQIFYPRLSKTQTSGYTKVRVTAPSSYSSLEIKDKGCKIPYSQNRLPVSNKQKIGSLMNFPILMGSVVSLYHPNLRIQ